MRDNGEATVILSVAGAVATGSPFILAVSGRQFGDGVIWAGAIVAALTAIGIGVAKLWRILRSAVLALDGIANLEVTADRMELRQLAMSEQLRDINQQLEEGNEHGRRILEAAEHNRQRAEEHGLTGLIPLPDK